MSKFRVALALSVLLLPFAAAADIDNLPADTVWYFHADLDAMRTGDAGSKVWGWFEEEVGAEVREEVGIDIGEEVDAVTAFAYGDEESVVIVEGPMTQETRDKILALAALEGPVDPREHDGATFYFFGDEDDIDDPADELLEDLEDAVFVSFAIDGKVLITGREEQMQDLLDNDGRITGSGSHDGALLVLTANQPLVQAGMQPDGLVIEDDDDDWESKIVSNTREAALLLADESGQLAIEARLVSEDPKMAEAIGGIVNGLIALQAFNSELETEVQTLIQNTKVEVDENTLSISTVIDPDLVVSVLND